MVNNKQNIFAEWSLWHFYEVPKFLLGVWKNYILFASNYFSFVILLKSLFAPWRKYTWKYPSVFNVKEFISTFISNMFSRILGAGMRIVLIIAGIFFQIFVLGAGAIVFLFWIFSPFVAIGAFLFVLFY